MRSRGRDYTGCLYEEFGYTSSGSAPILCGYPGKPSHLFSWPGGPRKAMTTGCFSLLILALTHAMTSLGVFLQLESKDNNNDLFNKGCCVD